MKLITCLSLILLFFTSCGKSDSNINVQVLKNLLVENNLLSVSLEKKIILISNTATCAPSLNEIRWWNKNKNEFDNTEIKLLILSKHKSTAKALVNVEKIDIPLYFDDISTLNNEIRLELPLRVILDKNGNILKISTLGNDNHLDEFLSLI